MNQALDTIYDSLLSSYHSKNYDEYVEDTEEAREQIKKLKPPAPKDIKPYPKLTDPHFNERVYSKKEFNRYKLHPEYSANTTYDDVAQQKCSTREFKLTANQKLLKNFLSPLTPYNSLLLYHGVGVGKCHARDTPIIMYDGSIKMVQDIVEGDLLMGDDGTPRTVLSLARGRDVMYEVLPDLGGDPFTVNSEHILCLMDVEGQVHEITIKDYLEQAHHLPSMFLYRAQIDRFECQPYALLDKDPYLVDLGITDAYLFHHRDTRLHVLAGIIDRHRVFDTTHLDVVLNVPQGAHDRVCFLARSLGVGAYKQDDNIVLFGNGLHDVPLRISDRSISAKNSTMTSFNVVAKSEDDYFGFTLDGNNRYLLGDFTVTHNTCTAISIAEQYLLEPRSKRVLVILSSNIKDNFKKQIFDITRYNMETGASTLCTGTKYPDMILDKRLLTSAMLEKRIARLIKDRYQFMGYKELVELVKRVRDYIEKLEKNPNKHQQRFEEKIKEMFSDRLIIVDEAHNLRIPAETGNKQVSNTLMQILEIAEDTKLLLLTATPMFNTSKEIVYMLKMMLTNDKRATAIKLSGIFDKAGNLTETGKKTLIKASRGYISYMRGENPFSFPFRLYPSINDDSRVIAKWPFKDASGAKILKEDRIKYLELVGSAMSPLQKKVYDQIKANVEIMDEQDEDEPQDDDNATNDLQNTIQLCNITYPNDKASSVKGYYGKQGFEACFDRVDKKYFRYKEHVVKAYGEIFSYDKIGDYAPKIKTILDCIVQSKGIVFIYSQYYYSGIFPLALALEHIGFSRHGSTKPICQNAKSISNLMGKKRASYIIISRDKEFSPNNDKEIAEAKAKANCNGEEIKVIIVSKVGTEGIDFKHIREVHILEPWFNLNRTEQIIGRAVRTCSHMDLPLQERNVTIYMHAAQYSDKEESIDIKTYRIAEKKQRAISEVQRILKQSAIDCNLNQTNLVYPLDKVNMRVTLTTSQGKTIKDYKVGDRDFSYMCDYGECYISCTPSYAEGTKDVDDTTFDPMFIVDDIDLYKRYVVSVVSPTSPFTFQQMHAKLQEVYKTNIEEDILAYALQEMVQAQYKFKLPSGHEGYLLYRGDLYIFQNLRHKEVKLALEERDVKKKHSKLDFHALRVQSKPEKVVPSPQPNASNAQEVKRETLASIQKTLKEARKLVKQLPKPSVMKDSHVVESIVDKLTIAEAVAVVTSEDEELKEALVKTGVVLDKGKLYIYDPTNDKFYSVASDGTYKAVGPLELSKISQQAKALKDALVTKHNTYTGLIEVSKKGEAQFKIRDNPRTKGFVCHQTSSLPIEQLKTRIESEGQQLPEENKLSKKQLCYIYELILRSKGPSTFKRTHVKTD